MFSLSDRSIRAVRPGLLRNIRTLVQITFAVTLTLSVIAVPYRLSRRQELPTKPAYSLQKVQMEGFANSVVNGINAQGDAVGMAWKNDNDTFHSFVWHNGKATELEKPPGATEALAFAINDKDEIAGAALMSDNSVVGVRWRGHRVVSTLALPGRVIFPTAINNAGQVAGSHSEPG